MGPITSSAAPRRSTGISRPIRTTERRAQATVALAESAERELHSTDTSDDADPSQRAALFAQPSRPAVEGLILRVSKSVLTTR
jgi:hypothetical protein